MTVRVEHVRGPGLRARRIFSIPSSIALEVASEFPRTRCGGVNDGPDTAPRFRSHPMAMASSIASRSQLRESAGVLSVTMTVVAFDKQCPDVLLGVVNGDDDQCGLTGLQQIAHLAELILGDVVPEVTGDHTGRRPRRPPWLPRWQGT